MARAGSRPIFGAGPWRPRTRQRPARSRRARTCGLAYAFLATQLLAIGAYFAVPGLQAKSAVYLGVAAAAATAAAWGMRANRLPGGRGWGFLAGGLALFAAGEVVWALYDLRGQEPPFPSPADALWVAGYVCLLAGAGLLVGRSRQGALACTLEAAVVGAACGLFVWAVLLPEHFDGGGLAEGFAALYPTVDAIFLAAILQLVFAPALRGSQSARALLLGAVLLLPTDVLWGTGLAEGTYASGAWLDAGWLASYALLGFAALHPGSRRLSAADLEPARTTPRRLALLLSFTLLAPVSLAVEAAQGQRHLLVFACWGSAIVLLVFARTTLLFREQQRTADELRRSQQLYRLVVEGSGDMIALTDSQGRYLWVSPAFERTRGYSTEELLGTGVLDYVHPDDLARVEESLRQLSASPGPLHCPAARFRRKDGGWLEVEATVTAIEGSGQHGPVRLAISCDMTERVRAERELREREELVNSIFEHSAAGLVLGDAGGRWLRLNPAFCELLGYTEEELLAVDFTHVTHPDDLAATKELHELLLRGEADSAQVEKRYVRKNGSTIWALLTLGCVRGADGQPIRLVGQIQDITARKQAEEALRESEALLSAVHEHSSAAIGIASLEKRWVKVNPAFCELLGYTEEELLALDPRAITHPDDVAASAEMHERVLSGEVASAQLEKRYLHKDGSTVWVLLTLGCVRGADGRPVLLVGQKQDITARKQAEEALREGEELFRTMFESSAAGVGLTGYDGRWLKVNPALCELLGYTEEELLALDFGRVTHPDDLAASHELREPLLRGEADSAQVEKRYVRKDGSTIWALLNLACARGAGGQAIHFIAQIQDITARKQAEETLREREELLTTMFDCSAAGLGLTDREGRWLRVNPALCELLGYTEEELLGTRVHDVVHPDDLPHQLEMAASLWRGEVDSVQLEKRVLRKDGGIAWVLLSLACLRDAGGGSGLFFGQIQDVTARKKAEEELRLLAEAATILNRSLHPREVSGAFAGIVRGLMDCERFVVTSYDPADGLLRVVYAEAEGDTIDPHTLPPLPVDLEGRGMASEAIRTQEPLLVRDLAERVHFHVDRQCRRLDRVPEGEEPLRSSLVVPIVVDGESRGAVSLFSTRPQAYSENDRQVLVALVSQVGVAAKNSLLFQQARREVEERREAEQALADRERLLQGIVDAEPECVKLVDLDGRITMMNPAGLRMCGATSEEQVLGHDCRELIVPADLPVLEAAFAAAIAEGQGRAEFGLLGLDGECRRMDSVIAPLRDEAGEVRSLISVTRDVTERHELEDQLRQSQKMEAVGRLAGGVAHDFNNLLTAISGYTGLAASRAGASRELREDLAQIERASSRAADLTRQLLAFSRRQLLQPRVLDVNEAVESAASLLRPLVGEQVDFSLDLAPEAGAVKADSGQLAQVLVNLVVNALDAMPDGGRLSIETGHAAGDEVPSAPRFGKPPGRYTAIAVSDTGCGMSEEIAAQVFEPFFTTKGAAGTGLGLSTVYGIVKQSGGHITVESEPDAGTTFRVYLPYADEPPAVVEAASPAAPARGSETILLVEDEEVVRSLVKEVLEQDGYTVVAAAGPAEALELCSSGCEFDLLLTDLVMPGMDGRDLARRIRECHSELAVLLVSGYAEQELEQNGSTGPPTAFLQKPFMAGDLVAAIRGLLDETRSSAVAA